MFVMVLLGVGWFAHPSHPIDVCIRICSGPLSVQNGRCIASLRHTPCLVVISTVAVCDVGVRVVVCILPSTLRNIVVRDPVMGRRVVFIVMMSTISTTCLATP